MGLLFRGASLNPTSCLQLMFWASLGIILYTYALYPSLLYLLSQIRPRIWHKSPWFPTVTVILAVHNGEQHLIRKIDELVALDYPESLVDVIVISDGSTDKTNDILRRMDRSRLTSIIIPHHRGKALALNQGIQQAAGEVLFFVDVRPLIPRDTLARLVSNLSDSTIGAAGAALILRRDGHQAATAAVTDFYWKYEQWIRSSESKTDSVTGVYGGCYVARRSLAKELPEGVINDDVLQVLSIARQGYRVVCDDHAFAFDIWPKQLKDEFNRKVRTQAGIFQMLSVEPWLLTRANRLRFRLISHKLVRLAVPPALIALVIISGLLAKHSVVFASLFAFQLLMYALALLGFGRSIPLLRQVAGAANAFCMLNLASVCGCWKFLFVQGPLWKIWFPQESQEAGRISGTTHFGKGS